MAFYYSSARELLRELGASKMLKKQEHCLQVYFDRSLLQSSRIAGACIQDGHLFNLVQEYENNRYKRDDRMDTVISNFMRSVLLPCDHLTSFRLNDDFKANILRIYILRSKHSLISFIISKILYSTEYTSS